MAETCPAAINLAGEHFPCDWPTNENGEHKGWAHTNRDAEAQWTSSLAFDGLPTPPAPESATPSPVVAEAPGMATMSDGSEGAGDNFRVGECSPAPGCGCLCHRPGGMAVSHFAPCCDAPPESAGDPSACVEGGGGL